MTCRPPAVRYYYHYTARLGPELFGPWDYTQSLKRVSAPLLAGLRLLQPFRYLISLSLPTPVTQNSVASA